MCEKADWHKYVNPKRTVKFMAHLLRLGNFSTTSSFQSTTCYPCWTYVDLALISMSFWNVSYHRIKATPRNFHGSFILNNSKLSTYFYATNRLLLLTTRKTEKRMPASTVMGGLCFHKMVYSAFVICFKSFYRS